MAPTSTLLPVPAIVTPFTVPSSQPDTSWQTTSDARSCTAPETGRDRPGPALPLTPREIARSLVERQDLWRPLVRFTEPRFHTRIATAPGWEVWLLTWLPGQSTAQHDHGGSAGAFAVLAGTVDEDVPVPYVATRAGRPRLVTPRVRDPNLLLTLASDEREHR
jgi:Cysteine dioxygenase type I